MITVVTICLNAEKYIERTLSSVLSQRAVNIDYIIKDGGSTDRTNEIIKNRLKLNETIAINHIIEKDAGIYNAMNQAISYAKGKWILFMNAGDCFYNADVLHNLSLYLDKIDADIVYGNTLYMLDNTYSFVQIHDITNMHDFFSLGHQSTLVRTEIMKEFLFREHFKIAGDYDLFIRLMEAKKKFYQVNMIISCCDREGVSAQKKEVMYRENYEIHHGIGSAKGKEYRKGLKRWRIKARISKMFPNWEKQRFCKNSMKRFRNTR